jgi:DNA-binding LytR/AlgR family response regulator
MYENFFISTEQGFIKFNSQDIYYITTFDRKTKILTSLGDFIISSSLSRLEKEILPQAIFCRVHRSYIVCLENINAFDLDEVQINGEKIPLEKGYRNRLFSNTRIIW